MRKTRTRLAVLALAVAGLFSFGTQVGQAHARISDEPGHGHHWACVGEIDINIGVCVDNPIPPPPY